MDAKVMCIAMALLNEHGEDQARIFLEERALNAYFADHTSEHDAAVRMINALDKLIRAFGTGRTVH